MSGYRPIYTRDEDLIILKAIIESNSYYRIQGKALWEDISQWGWIDRTAQSIKERFDKFILPRINDYQITNKQKKLFGLAHHQITTSPKAKGSDDEYSNDASDDLDDNDEAEESDNGVKAGS